MTDTYLPISRINQFIYCPRRFWLIFVEDSMEVGIEVLEGIIHHSSVHSQSLSKARITAFPVASERLRIVGVIDVVEPTPEGYQIVEHKRGSTRQWENDQLQVTAQAIAFEEATGLSVNMGSVFSWKSRRRYHFPITQELCERVELVVQDMHTTLANGHRPYPTDERHKCKRCSLHDVCQPALIRKMHKRRNK